MKRENLPLVGFLEILPIGSHSFNYYGMCSLKLSIPYIGVFPTRVGMNPRTPCEHAGNESIPHTRGDEPEIGKERFLPHRHVDEPHGKNN